MTTFTINQQNEIVAFATAQEATAATEAPFDTFTSQQELDGLAAQWHGNRLVEIWNSLPGVTPVKKFQSRQTAVRRIWSCIQSLAVNDTPQSQTETAPMVAEHLGEVDTVPPKRSTNRAKAARKAAPRPTTRDRRVTAPLTARGARTGTKMSQVVALLQRKNGATLEEITARMGWQRHTVRGFIAGTLKRAGYTVESFLSERGERTYRLPA